MGHARKEQLMGGSKAPPGKDVKGNRKPVQHLWRRQRF